MDVDMNYWLLLMSIERGIEHLEDIERRLGKRPIDEDAYATHAQLIHLTGETDVVAQINKLMELKERLEAEYLRWTAHTSETYRGTRPPKVDDPRGFIRLNVSLPP
jgi:hypothetical protein